MESEDGKSMASCCCPSFESGGFWELVVMLFVWSPHATSVIADATTVTLDPGTWHAVYSSPIYSQSRHSEQFCVVCGVSHLSTVTYLVSGRRSLDPGLALSSRLPCCSASELQSHDAPAQKWLPHMKSWVKMFIKSRQAILFGVLSRSDGMIRAQSSVFREFTGKLRARGISWVQEY